MNHPFNIPWFLWNVLRVNSTVIQASFKPGSGECDFLTYFTAKEHACDVKRLGFCALEQRI